MKEKTRLRFGMIAFFTMIAVAVLKNWFPGISVEIILGAAVPVTGYILGETFRSSKK